MRSLSELSAAVNGSFAVLGSPRATPRDRPSLWLSLLPIKKRIRGRADIAGQCARLLADRTDLMSEFYAEPSQALRQSTQPAALGA